MRWLILAFGLAVGSVTAGDLVVTSWNLQWFPSGSPRKSSVEVEAERIRAAASTLRAIGPDVVALQEVRDFETCERLALEAGELKVVVCSRFREFGGTLGWQQVAILAKSDAVSGWSENWATAGAIDVPRGFAFAHLRYGTNDVAVYALHLKSNLVRDSNEKSVQLNLLKRELAAEQLVRHLRATETKLNERFEVVVVAGDFNTNREQFPSELTLGTLESEGFSSGFESVPLAERITHLGGGRFADATFDYVFTRGARAARVPMVLRSTVSDHFPVSRTISLR